MSRWLALALLVGCAADLEEAAGPDFGKADGTDAPDHDCRVILRELDGLSHGRLEVEAALVDDGARPAVLLSFDGRTFFELDELSATTGGVAGYQRFAFSIDVPSGQSDARVEIVPFVKHHGSRLFDHNRHPANTENYVAEKASGHKIPLDEQTCPAKLDHWGPLVELRDDTQMFPAGKPAGGWWVTPIHATLLTDGKVLITGWSRRDHQQCGDGGSRKNGTTFLLDPDDVSSGMLNITPIDEQPELPSDVLYCAGHAPMADGRILYAGGSRYQGLGTPSQLELGLDYARVFDPASRSFERVSARMTGGPSGLEGMRWYPTTTRLPDNRVLVTGGFTRCCGSQFTNLSVEAFDPQAFDAGNTPWTTLVTHAQGSPEIGSSIKDFPRVFALPAQVPQQAAGGISRQVAILGAAGKVMLLNTRPDVPGSLRITAAAHAQRPGNITADDATVAQVSTGELLVVGGTPDAAAAQRADLYDPIGDRWRSIDTGISRYNAASVLLPDGTTLIVNGDGGTAGDRRRPQILDPRTGTIASMPPWPDDAGVRGYHSWALLLRDGRVLIGGGTNSQHDIGCERPDLRIYEPAYLHKAARPTITTSGTPTFTIGGAPVAIDVSGGPLAARSGAVLMALGSFTHGFDENQRYIPLAFDEPSAGRVALQPPASASIAPPGDYMLFVVSAAGVPSTGVHVRVAASTVPLCRVTFTVNGPSDLTTFGQDVRIAGAIEELGRWSGAEGVKLSGAQFPRWQGTALLPQGATIQYKAVVFDPATGGVRFETGADRSAAIPSGPGCSIDLVQDFRR